MGTLLVMDVPGAFVAGQRRYRGRVVSGALIKSASQRPQGLKPLILAERYGRPEGRPLQSL